MEFVSSVDTEYSVVSAKWLHDRLVDFAERYGHVWLGERWSNELRAHRDEVPMCIDVNCTLMNPAPNNRYWFRVAPDSGWSWESRSYSTWQSKEPHTFEEAGECETEVDVLARFETFLSFRILPDERPAVPGAAFDRGLNLGLIDELLTPLGVPRFRPAAPRPDTFELRGAQPASTVDETPDLAALIARTSAVPPGQSGAHQYHRSVLGVLARLFEPHLVDFEIEEEIDRGTKRVDIVAVNAAKDGFFDWVRLNFPPAPYVLIECKNRTVDPSNPELDQLLGRFSAQRGQFGLLMCRTVLDLDLLMIRCREAFRGGRGAIVPITDTDLLVLAREKAEHGDFPLLRDRFRRLTM